MILIGQFDSPYVRRVAVSLHLLGHTFERRLLSVFSNAGEMRRLNPLGRVPALVLDDGQVLIDSAAILDHLDELAGHQSALLPPNGPARRQALQAMALATGCSDKAMALAYERRRDSGKIDEDWLTRCRTQLDSGLAALDTLGLPPPGARLTQRDITVATALGYVRIREPDAVQPGRYPSLDRLAIACEARSEFIACRPTPKEIGGADAAAAMHRLANPRTEP